MTVLKKETVTYFVVDFSDLQEFIQKVFKHRFNFSADQEAGNDTEHQFIVTGKLTEFDQRAVEEFRTTGKGTSLCEKLLNSAASQAIIEPGTYLVKLSW